MSELINKIALITGASSGIGAACAKRLAKENVKLILAARRLSRLEALVESLKTINPTLECHLVQLDVTDREAVKMAIAQLPHAWQSIDILINNAGLAAGREKIQEANIDDWEAMIDTNVKGLLYMTRSILPVMLKNNHGHIVNIGSVAAHYAYAGGSVYCGSKACVRAISQAMRQDICGSAIRVTEIDPGLVETEFSLVRFKGNETMAKNVYQGLTPLSPEDVADAVLYSVTRPAHVNISEMILYPTAQASVLMTHREDISNSKR